MILLGEGGDKKLEAHVMNDSEGADHPMVNITLIWKLIPRK